MKTGFNSMFLVSE